MELNIKINLDNSAYDDLGWELGKNLEWIISEIGLGNTRGRVRDSNGNCTGQWMIDNEDKKFIEDHFKFIKIGD